MVETRTLPPARGNNAHFAINLARPQGGAVKKGRPKPQKRGPAVQRSIDAVRKIVAPLFIPQGNFLRCKSVRFTAPLAAVHTALHGLKAVAAAFLAAYTAHLLAFRGVHPVVMLIARIAAAHTCAVVPLARQRLGLAAQGTNLLAFPLHRFKKMMLVPLLAAALAAAAAPFVSEHTAEKGHAFHLGSSD